MSIGKNRVRAGFNPSGDQRVESIKSLSAQLIDICEDLKAKEPRCAALAQTAYEEAAMWAVKAATATALAFGLFLSTPAFADDDAVPQRAIAAINALQQQRNDAMDSAVQARADVAALREHYEARLATAMEWLKAAQAK